MTSPKLDLVPCQDTFTPPLLAKKAADIYGFQLQEHISSLRTPVLASWKLDGLRLARLTDQGFKCLRAAAGNISIRDKYGHSWIFENENLTAEVEEEIVETPRVSFYLKFSVECGGVLIYPYVEARFTPLEKLAHLRLVKSLVWAGPSALWPKSLQKMLESGQPLLVSWTEMGLGDLLEISRLFNSFIKGRPALQRLAGSNISPFDPPPYNPATSSPENPQPANLYIHSSVQQELMGKWEHDWVKHGQALGYPI